MSNSLDELAGKGQAAYSGGITDTKDHLSILGQQLEGASNLTSYCKGPSKGGAVEGMEREEGNICEVTEKSEDREFMMNYVCLIY